ncbi:MULTISPECIES: DUF3883 domain-containing protein [Burkholderia cepacia complex]|uniref:Protein NO VEIN C-terminal domain-containing protein n=2 Tax=Burkholderia cepacia complex TaxID=87882 RepID=A0AAW3NZF4_9BURK|nr:MULTISPECIES: DUF3883 domain-containing protein [Burkholderia cepacia complex]AOK15145.1 hypothetical protein WT26_03340 [Burkholderia cepacia]AOK21863.1 hypothetical protein WK67_03330 [Burkholderia ubonensis]KVN74614.1 hypothetical protein WJ68_28980 [Burkholderia ubonensis]KVU45262.1 hypothetical protein WK69_15715 [Burkholderia ubonensis]KVZ62579.1 hypothetical protein WL19_29765 [Burkholderia ubonensis]
MGIQEIKDPAAIRAAMDEYDRVGRTYFLEKYGFGKARDYMLRDPETGHLYDSKAIVGAAYGYAFPEGASLSSADFVGGEATVERLLTNLGFEVVRIGQDWSREEVEATVQDYFQMLRREASGQAFNKSEHNDQLRQKLRARSKGSVEMKHQNISAVLDQLDLPYIRGYKPRSNFQELLREVVVAYIQREQPVLQTIVDAIEEQTEPGNKTYRGVLIEPPIPETLPSTKQRKRLPRKLDYAARDERNRSLGRNGESWVVGYEEARLTESLRPDLAAKIDWISDRCGDGTGYDIMSYEVDELSRFIEVKTTNGGSLTPFVVSRNELEFSEEAEDAFCLYRLFDFAKTPRLFILRGALSDSVHLEAIDYRARLKAVSR